MNSAEVEGAAPRAPRITTLATLGLMIWLTVRIFRNRLGARIRNTPTGRTATRRKHAGVGNVLLGFMLLVFLCQGFSIGFSTYMGLENAVPRPLALAASTRSSLRILAQHLPVPTAELERIFEQDPAFSSQPPAVRTALAAQWAAWVQVHGATTLIDAPGTGFSMGDSGDLRRALAGALLVISLAVICLNLGMGAQDLGQVQWNVLWLATMPVPMRALLLAKIGEYLVVNPMLYMAYGPFSAIIIYHAGAGWWTVPIAVLLTIGVGMILAALRLVIETALRMHWPPGRVKNLQAVMTLLGIVLILPLFAMGANPWLPAAFLQCCKSLPLGVLPTSAPTWMAAGGSLGAAAIWLAPLAILACGATAVMAAVACAERMLRFGMILQSGAYAGRRTDGSNTAALPGQTAAEPGHGTLLSLAGKDLLLLRRDRNLLVQVFALPVVMVGFQFVIHPHLLRMLSDNLHHGAAASFGLGAYILVIIGLATLSSEGQGLWLLYCAPMALERILLRKCLVYILIAGGFTAASLLTMAWIHPHGAPGLWLAVLALAGIVIYSVIITAIGVLAGRPMEVVQSRKMNTGVVYGTMLLIAMYSVSLYVNSLHQELVQLVLSVLVAGSLWQRVRDQVPYLLDPTEAPPPTISLGDGLIALLIFFALQTALGLILAAYGPALAPWTSMTIAYAVAGMVVMILSLLSFWRMGVSDLPRRLGLVAQGSTPRAYTRALLGGIVGGLVCACGAWVYLHEVVSRIPLLAGAQAQTAAAGAGFSLPWAIALLVVAAPLAEEYLFRGLIFRGLRRSTTLPWAVLGSAGLFALIHPGIAVVPVFLLGIATSLVYEYSGLLLGGVVVHALYNALVLFMNVSGR